MPSVARKPASQQHVHFQPARMMRKGSSRRVICRLHRFWVVAIFCVQRITRVRRDSRGDQRRFRAAHRLRCGHILTVPLSWDSSQNILQTVIAQRIVCRLARTRIPRSEPPSTVLRTAIFINAYGGLHNSWCTYRAFLREAHASKKCIKNSRATHKFFSGSRISAHMPRATDNLTTRARSVAKRTNRLLCQT